MTILKAPIYSFLNGRLYGEGRLAGPPAELNDNFILSPLNLSSLEILGSLMSRSII